MCNQNYVPGIVVLIMYNKSLEQFYKIHHKENKNQAKMFSTSNHSIMDLIWLCCCVDCVLFCGHLPGMDEHQHQQDYLSLHLSTYQGEWAWAVHDDLLHVPDLLQLHPLQQDVLQAAWVGRGEPQLHKDEANGGVVRNIWPRLFSVVWIILYL